MDWGIVVLLIVVIGAVTSTVQTAITARAGKSSREPSHLAAHDGRVSDEVLALKERVAVLERIATDRSHALEHEIERLRDR